MQLTFLINEGQRVETAVCDLGLGGKALIVSVVELEPASGDDVYLVHAELPFLPNQSFRVDTEDTTTGTQVSVSIL